jgi:uncharacterized protein (TIGR03382 family)
MVTVNDGVSSDSQVVKISAKTADTPSRNSGGGGSVPLLLVVIGLALVARRKR